MKKDRVSISQVLHTAGFLVSETGGGFRAFRLDLKGDAYILITQEGDLPTNKRGPFEACFYADGDNTQVYAEGFSLESTMQFVENWRKQRGEK